MRPSITTASVLTYDLVAMMPATLARLLRVSMYFEASRIAATMARAVFGYFCTNSAVVPSTFSG